MKAEIKEKGFSNFSNPISIERLETHISKTKTNICKIECSDGGHGTGFFCNIPISWLQTIKVLMTNNHVLNQEDLLLNKVINFSINNEEEHYKILIDESRKIYTNKKYDITIIELKEKDKINENYFFEIDSGIFHKNSKEIFTKKDIILLHYPKGIKMEYSNGKIQNICEDNYTFHHSCCTNNGSSGGPIINSINCQVIGVHRGASTKNYNLGTFLKEPINKFKEQINKSQNNKRNLKKDYKKNITSKNSINRNIDNKKEDEKIINKNISEIGCQSLSSSIKISRRNTQNIDNMKKSINSYLSSSDISKFNLHDNIIKNNYIKINKNIKSKSIINKNVDEITIQYKIKNIKNIKSIRIFGDEFVKNNKEKCKIIIKGKEMKLCSLININLKQINSNKIYEIKLIGINNIINISYMFYGCSSLSSLPYISKWNPQNIIDMRNMFYGCSSLLCLPDISKWNTQNVTCISYIFYGCSSLSSLPDISKWNIQNVTDMSNIFYGCSALSSLPDISKWNTQNVINMSFMFYKCSSLSSIPNISKWNTRNVTDMSDMFYECSSLLSFPDISKWNTQNVTNMSDMFNGCSSLSFLPDISKWNTQNVTNMSFMFYGCSSLLSLSDISKWNTQNVIYMEGMFYECSSLSSLPDISKWNTQSVTNTNMNDMFNGIKNLKFPEKFKE